MSAMHGPRKFQLSVHGQFGLTEFLDMTRNIAGLAHVRSALFDEPGKKTDALVTLIGTTHESDAQLEAVLMQVKGVSEVSGTTKEESDGTKT